MNFYHESSSITSQRVRLLSALRLRAMSTIEIRHQLDILAVAPRIFELRRLGYNIKTIWVDGVNPGGRRHRIAKYVLLPGKYKGGK